MASNNGKETEVTELPLTHWAFSGNVKLQLILLVIVIGVVFARVLPLEMQKRIVNDAIVHKNFNDLILYCMIYLLSVVTASGLKLAINYLQAVIGERAMVAMREALYKHILTLPLNFFRTTQPGMVVSSLMTELSTAGSFAGMALAVPLTNILTLVAFAVYLMWLNPKLALATLCIYPIVVFLVPVLQKKSNAANRERVDISRKVSSHIAESVTGIAEVQVHGAYEQEGKRYNKLVQRLREVRVRWSLLKFGIKTTNNFFVSLGPFVVFIFGGYLVMIGQMELGAMVAFLSAQEKLYDPWKELIQCYQVYQDAKVRYERTMKHFDATPEFMPTGFGQETTALSGAVDVQNLGYITKEGVKLLDGVNLNLRAGEHLAVVGFSGSGKSTFIKCVGQMYKYTSGFVKIDGQEVTELSKNNLINSVGFISQTPFVFTGSIEENLLYAADAASVPVNENRAGEEDSAAGLDKMILALQQAGLFADVMRFGLDTIGDSSDQEKIDRIIRMRGQFKESFGESLKDAVEFYNEQKYLLYSTVAENIFFGTSRDTRFSLETLIKDAGFKQFLNKAGIFEPMLQLGAAVADKAVNLAVELEDEIQVTEALPVTVDQIDDCRLLLVALEKGGPASLEEQDKLLLLSLALRFSPGVHKEVALSGELEKQLLSARTAWTMETELTDRYNFVRYQGDSYIHGESILNNIFFGRARTDMAKAQDRINQAIIHLLIEEDWLEEIAEIGMKFQVGSMGDRLSGGQRQKLAIARVLLKQPNIVIMDEATSALDNKSQSRIQNLIETRWKGKRTVISVVHRLDSIKNFDKVAVMKAGKIMEIGSYDELLDKKGGLYELVHGKNS